MHSDAGVAEIDHAGTWALARLQDAAGRVFPALVSRDRVLDLSDRAELGRPDGTAPLLDRWDDVLPVLRELARSTEGWAPLAGSTLLSPVTPRQVFQAGANYRTHVLDLVVAHHDGSDGRTPEQVRADAAAHMDERLALPPFVFQGLPSAICGASDDVVLPRDGEQPDWELELAVVIGRRARRVPVADALDVVAGWTIVNDLTLREKVFRKDSPALGADWLAAKNSPTFLPTGPVLVPREALPDPGDLRLTLRLNGDVMQDESTKDMVVDVARLVAYCSEVATLLPGDLVLTGSPAGNGLAHGRLLRAGDVMHSTITGLGAQSNRCVDET
ncbi:fumarylacetoacetate hydrolase family protein [Modestobacter versicolor]|uniref:2-keto-4-pentenoate hydratase/2-oxohepta-3-ene-1,7-dioic acid hydratase in catechol pathway n=1 Tax=Modestobacter versicolor TaxID=429133 RepID=A0A323VBS1_9ACTN|nr:fumarylacetoacetate hydrolase family protein [Modestobacter versicolor]MBB3674770.1 2-keto-4-pentenoate hydratase/2-oxohepta-3-ene-1,7-dioic acid hydratase in catechol pathway [Modestobacter versicolor]PZA22145.1 hydrolase [Modestobacter versicolor]